MTQIRGWRYILLVLGLAILAWMVMEFNGRMAQLKRLTQERVGVDARYAEVKGTLTALEADVAFAQSDAAVVKWAYEEGHLVRPGDYAVVPVASGPITPTPAPKPSIVQTKLSNPESWRALVFGLKAP